MIITDKSEVFKKLLSDIEWLKSVASEKYYVNYGKYIAGCDPVDEKASIYTNPEFIVCRVTQMRGCKEEGANLYNVNNDGSVTPWANPPESVSKALEERYTIHTIEYMGEEFIIRKNIKDKGDADK